MKDSEIIPILGSDGINPIFIKANSFLLKKFRQQFQSATTRDKKKKKLAELWKSEFSADLIEHSNLKIWEYIKFQDTQTQTIFLLKFLSA